MSQHFSDLKAMTFATMLFLMTIKNAWVILISVKRHSYHNLSKRHSNPKYSETKTDRQKKFF